MTGGLLWELFDAPPGDRAALEPSLNAARVEAVLREPGVQGGRVYDATKAYTAQDGPRYLVVFELDPAAVDRLARDPRALGPALHGRPEPCARRVYRQIQEVGAVQRAAPFVLAGAMTLPATQRDRYEAYYEEHLALLHRIVGWSRSRRFERLAGDGPEFLAMHDLLTLDALGSPLHRIAAETELSALVAASRTAYERTLYRLVRSLRPSD